MSITPVLHSFSYALGHLRTLTADVAGDDMAAQPKGVINHPAWTIGHLTYACELLGTVIGIPKWLPAEYESRFSTGTRPVADAAAYGPKDELLTRLDEAENRITDAAARLAECDLDRPFPVSSYLEVFPTVRHALTQVLVGHTAYHVGQLGVWRGAMGLPSTGRSFE